MIRARSFGLDPDARIGRPTPRRRRRPRGPRSVSRPPCGIASRALRIRLPRTIRSWSPSPRAWGSPGGQSTATSIPSPGGLISSASRTSGSTAIGRRSGTGILAKFDSAVITPSASVDVPLDPPQVLGLLLGRGVAGVEQVVDRRLDHVERVAQLVGDAAGDLPERRQPLAPLEPRRVLGLVGVLDDRQVEVEQLVERADRLLQGHGRRLASSRGGARISPVRSRDSATLV